MTVLDLLPFDL